MKTIDAIPEKNNNMSFDVVVIEKIIENFDQWNIEINDYKQHIVTLMMYERYYILNDIERPKKLHSVIVKLSQMLGIPEVPTYECLVCMNDLDNEPILFSGPDDQQSELLFYKTHLDIEHEIYGIFNIVKWIYDWTGNWGSLNNVWKLLNNAIRHMEGLIQNLSVEWFNNMRPYFDLRNHPYKKSDMSCYPGPSWAYSATFIFLDLITGTKPPNLDNYSLDDSMVPRIQWNGYITLPCINDLKGQILQQWNLLEKFPDFEPVREILKSVLRFRGLHMKIAMKMIWREDLKKPWTGWSKSAAKYLTEHINMTKSHIDESLLSN